MYRSSPLDPLAGLDFFTEQLGDGCCIIRSKNGDIARTCDAIGVTREYFKEPITNRLQMRSLGNWIKLENGCLDAAGNLFYTRGDVEIQERLNGVHIHTNRRTGVQIETDHVKHTETMRQAGGEVWKRYATKQSEIFEIWTKNTLSFQRECFNTPESVRIHAKTATGEQPLNFVDTREQSFHQGEVLREKFTFKNPLAGQDWVALLVQTRDGLIPLRNVTIVTTSFQSTRAVATFFETGEGTIIQIDAQGNMSESETLAKGKRESVAAMAVTPQSNTNVVRSV